MTKSLHNIQNVQHNVFRNNRRTRRQKRRENHYKDEYVQQNHFFIGQNLNEFEDISESVCDNTLKTSMGIMNVNSVISCFSSQTSTNLTLKLFQQRFFFAVNVR